MGANVPSEAIDRAERNTCVAHINRPENRTIELVNGGVVGSVNVSYAETREVADKQLSVEIAYFFNYLLDTSIVQQTALLYQLFHLLRLEIYQHQF